MTAIKNLGDASGTVPKCTLRANVDRRVVSSWRRDGTYTRLRGRIAQN